MGRRGPRGQSDVLTTFVPRAGRSGLPLGSEAVREARRVRAAVSPSGALRNEVTGRFERLQFPNLRLYRRRLIPKSPGGIPRPCPFASLKGQGAEGRLGASDSGSRYRICPCRAGAGSCCSPGPKGFARLQAPLRCSCCGLLGVTTFLDSIPKVALECDEEWESSSRTVAWEVAQRTTDLGQVRRSNADRKRAGLPLRTRPSFSASPLGSGGRGGQSRREGGA